MDRFDHKGSRMVQFFRDLYHQGQARAILFLSLIIIGVTILAAVIVFLLSIQGEEQITVPDVNGMALEKAVIELQEKALNARVQLHFSSNPANKGTVLEQEPEAGSIVKADSNIVLKVSRGAVIDRVEDYVGWKIEELEMHLQTLFTTYGPLLHIKRPVIKVHDETEPGTILEQSPEPGTKISGVTNLELVVSKGPEKQLKIVDNYVGMGFESAIDKLASRGLPFRFTVENPEEEVTPGTIISQKPTPGESVSDSTVRELTMSEPDDIEEGYVFGVLKRTLPEYPILVDVTLEAISTEGKRREILRTKHPGGEVSIPYILEENTLLILSVFEKEIIRYTVRPMRNQEAADTGPAEEQETEQEQESPQETESTG